MNHHWNNYYTDEGRKKAPNPETDITQCNKLLYFNYKARKGGQCGRISHKEGNRPGESHLISFNEDDYCDQQRYWMANISCITNSTTSTIVISYSKQELSLIIKLKA